MVHGHALVAHGLPGDWYFWQRHDVEHLAHCEDVVVLRLDGWEESEGVQEQLRLTAEMGKRVSYLPTTPRVKASPLQ